MILILDIFEKKTSKTPKSTAKRLVAAGGDTSGRIQEVLQIQAIQVATPIGIGAPLCYVYSNLPEINGLEVAFKTR